MKKLLIIYNKVWPYRERIFELINQEFELTVGFNDPKYIGKEYTFKTIFLTGKQIGPFFIHTVNLNRICKEYDAVIGIYDIRWLKLMLLSLNPFRKYSISYWGIGVTASYENKFDSKSKWDWVRYFFARKADSIILYSDYPIEKHVKFNVNRDKLFVAHNTVDVYFNEMKYSPTLKKNFLFVGTLYFQKGFDILINAYRKLLLKYPDAPNLDIVGDGPEKDIIYSTICSFNLQEKIILHGGIYEPAILSEYFSRSIACISPNQAGLSVLTSMGNATIYVTEKNAITGGEIFNIEPDTNGLIYEGYEDALAEKMQWILNNHDKVITMSSNARNHYLMNRNPVQMANSIIDSVKYAMAKHKRK